MKAQDGHLPSFQTRTRYPRKHDAQVSLGEKTGGPEHSATTNAREAEAKGEATSKTEGRTHMPTVTVAIGRAYERFLELPVPVVLVVLWLLGVLILGAVVMGLYSAVVWLSAAIAPL